MRPINLASLPGKLISALLAVISLVAAYFLMQQGLGQLTEARQLERLPVTPVAALADGPYLVSGVINVSQSTLTTPYSNSQAVYYRYRLKEEYRDSDGDVRTRVLESGEHGGNFDIADATGMVTVSPGERVPDIDWNIARSFVTTSDKKTYEEWALLPGDRAKAVGAYATDTNTLVFDGLVASHLPALVSGQTLGADSGDRLFSAAMRISLATGLLALGIALLLPLMQVHRFWVYVTLMSLAVAGTLTTLGVTQLQKEWRSITSLYEGRYQQSLTHPDNLLMLADVAALKHLIDRNTSGWLDQWMSRQVLEKDLPLPALNNETGARAMDIVASRPKGQFSRTWTGIGLSSGSALLALIMLYLAIRSVKFKRLVEAIPTTSTQGASFGLCELKGMIEVDDERAFIRDPLQDEKCVAFDYKVQEKRGSGKKSSWHTVEHRTEQVPFWLEDAHGTMLVRPEGATIEYHKHHSEIRGNRRYSVSLLDTYINIYCLGFAGLDEEHPDQLTLQQDAQSENNSPFLVSARTENEILIGRGTKSFIGVAASIGLILFATTTFFASDGLFSPGNLLISALVVPLVLMVYIAILHYNDMIFLRNRVDRALANIDTILQQRYDLWPNLEAAVKASLAHEKDLQTAIATLRSTPPGALDTPTQAGERMQREQQLTGQLLARIEGYPELKNHLVISQFMTIMTQTENYLSLLRNSHTESAEIYNTRIQSFPDVLLAKPFRFEPSDYFLSGSISGQLP